MAILIRDNPNVKAKVLQTQIKNTYGVEPSKRKIYRAKRKELKMLKFGHVDCYGQLRKYGNILLEMNLGSLAVVGIDTLSVTPKFQRFLLSFNAQITGFIRGCRPFIGLDGCHLKGPFGGVLLSVIPLDSYSGIFPIAVCVVENECRDSWSWFLGKLHEGLDVLDRTTTFMSDRQKGVLAAIKQQWPRADNRYCTRHFLANLTKECPRLKAGSYFWKSTYKVNRQDFMEAMRASKK
ncbi:hypothetical protein Ddye_025580 [Dipteronia dyeriana]|uniref:MULE transposase domain-containing protein n=1 Tax=Dipteronia dyeriana TaxID=168575 RepID=A0AAD9WPQ8_9ROSI|nr:hypothetical protein Ddye_025580 [Dipteronia dyeriana]